jgi:hypothetical protein
MFVRTMENVFTAEILLKKIIVETWYFEQDEHMDLCE